MKQNKAQPTLSLSLSLSLSLCEIDISRDSRGYEWSELCDNSSLRRGRYERGELYEGRALCQTRSDGYLRNRIRFLASIHPLNRAMEWACKRDKRGWLHEDICPTVTANEFRSVGNAIYEIYETE